MTTDPKTGLPEKKRRSRVLEYFEAKKAEEPAEDDASPFHDLDTELGLDEFGSGGAK